MSGSKHQNLKSRIYLFFIAALLATAAFLGYLIYLELRTSGNFYTESEKTGSSKSAFEIYGEERPGLTSDEKIALNRPEKEREQRKYFDAVVRAAKETAEIEIKNCNATPVVYKTKLGEEIKFKNLDPRSHKITFNSTDTYPLKAQSTDSLRIIFKIGPGIYGYGCESRNGPAGLILVE